MNAPAITLSVVIPVRNDAAALAALLGNLAEAPARDVEVIVVDGCSTDGSAGVGRQAGARVLTTQPGRGVQLAAGARAARGRWLWLLHADSSGVGEAFAFLLSLARDSAEGEPRRCWGRFDVAFVPRSPLLTAVAAAMAWRSRLSGICTGDQAMFVERRALERAGGVPEQALMEDIELSRRLKRLGPPVCRRERIITSARRWQRRGPLRTIAGMWWFRLRYWLGADPERLARAYYR